MPTYQPSVVIEDSDEHLIAAVEAQSRRDLSQDLAIDIRSRMFEYGLAAHVPYLMAVSQERGFLWKDNLSIHGDRPPDYEFPMDSVIARFSKIGPAGMFTKSILEWVILHWLTNLSFKPEEMGEREPEETLAHAGFTNAIHEAMVFMGDTQ